MNDMGFRNYIKLNVLTTSEVTDILQITKARVSKLVEEGAIIPVKKSSQGMLFLRNDIDKLIKKRNNEIGITIKKGEVLIDKSSSTRKSLIYFNENRYKLDKIVAVFIFFNKLDAALSNFYYNTSDATIFPDKQFLDTPYLVLRDNNGKEMWLCGCNCGYHGTGPNGTINILKSLRDELTLPSEQFTDELFDKIIWNRKITLIKENEENWDISATDSEFESASNHVAHLFYFKNKLILIQEPNHLWNKTDEGMLESYANFIPNPREIMIFPTNELAKENGYSIFTYHEEIYYNVIIIDSSGRELWFNALLENNNRAKILKQANIENILRLCNVNIDKDKIKDSKLKNILSWLDVNLRTVAIEPIHIEIDK